MEDHAVPEGKEKSVNVSRYGWIHNPRGGLIIIKAEKPGTYNCPLDHD